MPIPWTRCPTCDGLLGDPSNHAARPGDLCLCWHCYEGLVFGPGLTVRLAQLEDLSREPRGFELVVRAAIRRRLSKS